MAKAGRTAVVFKTSVVPYLNDFRDYQEALTGVDVINQQQLDGLDRSLTGVAAVVPYLPAKWLRFLRGPLEKLHDHLGKQLDKAQDLRGRQ